MYFSAKWAVLTVGNGVSFHTDGWLVALITGTMAIYLDFTDYFWTLDNVVARLCQAIFLKIFKDLNSSAGIYRKLKTISIDCGKFWSRNAFMESQWFEPLTNTTNVCANTKTQTNKRRPAAEGWECWHLERSMLGKGHPTASGACCQRAQPDQLPEIK